MLVAVLAGGEGRRIGGSKPQRLLAGETLLERALATVRYWDKKPVVVTRYDLPDTGCETIRDRSGIEGPLAGLAAAFDHARETEAACLLLLACDMPFLPGDVPERLAWMVDGGANCAMARSGGRDIPVCSMWSVAALGRALPQYLEGEDRSLFGLANMLNYVTVQWDAGEGDPFFNINTPEDLAEAGERLG
ncbi:molybdenum cofactor guanylyltransferase [Qipengyuania sp. 1NDH17]|uniref:Molybdenum cofactor guanylyltransferase n=1 Tax=Qipengyuania polymorpha TaxID=2867234 RepID=A0ABS7IXW2_9SPHN|nr:molybdenum cofactor guanylyltransferase [Qipengyuania polymorpha]MBX7458403.1 molybdenum cofactor guanylyltransferase [Qipengyuania polymorpha]